MYHCRNLKKSQGVLLPTAGKKSRALKKSEVPLSAINMLKSVNLMLENTLVHRGGKVFLQGFHVNPDKGKPTEKDKRLKKFFQLHPNKQHAVGAVVKFPDGGPHHKTGIIADSDSTHYTIRGKRTESGVVPIHRVPKGAAGGVISLEDYREHIESAAPKSDKKITGDKTHAHNTIDPVEWARLKTVMEQRTGIKESALVQHPKYVQGKVISLLQETPDRDEAMMVYHEAALKAFRTILGSDRKGTAHNVAEFKAVMNGTRDCSVAHYSAWRNGGNAVKKLLIANRRHKNLFEDQDIHDYELTPAGARILAQTATQPTHLDFTLAEHRETLPDEVKKVFKMLTPVEGELVFSRFGFGLPVAEQKSIEPVPAVEVAAHLNAHGIKALDGGIWTRSKVMTTLDKIKEKILKSPMRDALSWHVDEKMGRKMWKSQQEQTTAVINALLKEARR